MKNAGVIIRLEEACDLTSFCRHRDCSHSCKLKNCTWRDERRNIRGVVRGDSHLCDFCTGSECGENDGNKQFS